MRKVTALQALVFATLIALALALALATTALLLGRAPLGDFRGVTLAAAAALLFFAYAIGVYRLFLAVFPLRPGPNRARLASREFVYHVYVLFYLMVFYAVTRTHFTPAPLMRLVYIALGARLGDNTYSMGEIYDPPFVEIGRDSVVGGGAMLVPHVIEGVRLEHWPIRLGNNVTIGGRAMVFAGSEIGDGAIVAAGAIVGKGTRIGPGETWGGVPARLLRKAGQ